MYLLCFPLIPIWTAASSHSSQLVIIPTSHHPPAPLGLTLPTSFRTYHRFCLMTFSTTPLLSLATSSFRFGSPLFPCAFAPSIIYIGAYFLLAYCEIKDQMDKQQWHSTPLESLRPRSLHAKSPIPLRSHLNPP
ncbi:uncharacterized protein EI90DRAFT_3050069, partial [Cantharellus anzutake]|uniref:uncharacterized protein n=1 Tax=Cantharellus anzutake TaxID=1750568 RepID=UPI001907798C